MKNKTFRRIGFFLLATGSILFLTVSLPLLTSYFQHTKVESKVMELFNQAIESSQLEASTINWDNLMQYNSNFTGWITIQDTSISNAIVQYTDNTYYLTHDLGNKTSKYGSIFMDYRNTQDFTDANTILYGHNMQDGSMFHELVQYKTEDYFYEHPTITIYYESEILHYEIFSVYVVNADTETIPVYFASDDDFTDYLNKCQKRTLFEPDITLCESDKILTLVTCSYETDNARTIVQGRLT